MLENDERKWISVSMFHDYSSDRIPLGQNVVASSSIWAHKSTQSTKNQREYSRTIFKSHDSFIHHPDVLSAPFKLSKEIYRTFHSAFVHWLNKLTHKVYVVQTKNDLHSNLFCFCVNKFRENDGRERCLWTSCITC